MNRLTAATAAAIVALSIVGGCSGDAGPPAKDKPAESRPPDEPYSPFAAWSAFPEGSSVLIQSVGADGKSGRAWVTSELIHKELDAVAVRGITWIDADKVRQNTRKFSRRKLDPTDTCDECGKAAHRWQLVRAGERVKTFDNEHPEMICTLVELTCEGKDGKNPTTERHWINKDVPGWVVKATTVEAGKESVGTVLGGFTVKK